MTNKCRRGMQPCSPPLKSNSLQSHFLLSQQLVAARMPLTTLPSRIAARSGLWSLPPVPCTSSPRTLSQAVLSRTVTPGTGPLRPIVLGRLQNLRSLLESSSHAWSLSCYSQIHTHVHTQIHIHTPLVFHEACGFDVGWELEINPHNRLTSAQQGLFSSSPNITDGQQSTWPTTHGPV